MGLVETGLAVEGGGGLVIFSASYEFVGYVPKDLLRRLGSTGQYGEPK